MATNNSEVEDVVALIDREGLTLTEAAKLIPSRKRGKRVDVNTVWRWCKVGMASGLRLRSVMVGGVRYTTKSWLAEFIRSRSAPSPACGHNNAQEPPRSTTARRSASDRAAEELQRRWRRTA